MEGFTRGFILPTLSDAAEPAPCHIEWWEMCTSPNKFVAIAAPRGHAKSTVITVAYTIANIVCRQKRFVILVSDTETQSAFFLGNIKKHFTDNKSLIEAFGIRRLIKDTENDIIVEFDDGTEARIVAKGSEQKLRGLNWNGTRPDLIVCDDMENDEIVLNKDRRDKFKRWFLGALLPSRSRDGVVRLIGTVLHMDSLLENYMPRTYDKRTLFTALSEKSPPNSSQWVSAKYRANPSVDDFSLVLWPGYRDAEWLRNEQKGYRDQGLGDVYAQEYLNQPIDDSNSLFRKSDFSAMRDDDRGRNKNYYISMDLAVTTKNVSDYSVFVVGATDESNRLHIVEIVRERLDSHQLIGRMMQLNKKYNPSFMVMEKGQIASSIYPMIKLRMIEENNFFSMHMIASMTDKIQRSQSIRARMRSGQVKFDKEAEWYLGLEQEMIRFPRDRYDDQVDAMSLLGQALDKFVEAPTKKEVEEDEYEEFVHEYGWNDAGRSEITGY
jgi:predicted phage terminase large subunit-like protein